MKVNFFPVKIYNANYINKSVAFGQNEDKQYPIKMTEAQKKQKTREIEKEYKERLKDFAAEVYDVNLPVSLYYMQLHKLHEQKDCELRYFSDNSEIN